MPDCTVTVRDVSPGPAERFVLHKVDGSGRVAPGDAVTLRSVRTRRYLGVAAEQFEHDLAEKEWVIVLRDGAAGSQIVGFSTLMSLELPAQGQAVKAIFSGDTIVARERRRTVADDLYKKLVHEGQSFWEVVYPLYMNREITRANMRELVHKGLEQARGNYKIVLRLFNMSPGDYKRFLNFLRKHECQLPFKEYR